GKNLNAVTTALDDAPIEYFAFAKGLLGCSPAGDIDHYTAGGQCCTGAVAAHAATHLIPALLAIHTLHPVSGRKIIRSAFKGSSYCITDCLAVLGVDECEPFGVVRMPRL